MKKNFAFKSNNFSCFLYFYRICINKTSQWAFYSTIVFYNESHSNFDQREWIPLHCFFQRIFMHCLYSSSIASLSTFQIWFGRMFGYSENFWRDINLISKAKIKGCK